MKKPVVISVTNNKGGVGKTTASVHIAAAMAKYHKKPVLLIDFDTQANATQSLIGDAEIESDAGILTVLADDDTGLHNVYKETNIENLFLIPNEMKIDGRKITVNKILGFDMDPNNVLKRKLETDFIHNFSYVIIDCSPSIDVDVVNALIASDFYIIPTTADDLSIMGIGEILSFGSEVSKINKDLNLLGIFLNEVNKSHKKTKIGREIINDAVGDLKFKTEISSFVKFSNLPSKQQTIFDIQSPKEKGAVDYISLTNEIIDRITAFYSKNQHRKTSSNIQL
jgi:chromosome partitioning protein